MNNSVFDRDDEGYTKIVDVTRSALKALHATLGGRAKKVETLVVGLLHLLTQKDVLQFSSGVALLASALLDKTFLETALQYLQGGVGVGEQAGDDESPRLPPGGEPDTGGSVPAAAAEPPQEKARKNFGMGVDAWKTLRHTKLWGRARVVLGMCVAAGVVGTDVHTKYPKLWRRLGADMNKDCDALDAVEAVIDLVRVSWDTTAKCIQEGSYKALLSESESHAIDKEYAHVTAYHQLFMEGSYEAHTGEHERVYIHRVKALVERIQEAHTKAVGAEKAVLSRLMCSTMNLMTQVNDREISAKTRFEPYALCILGRTGVGKSSSTMAIMRDCLRILGAPHGDPYIAYLNVRENFDTVCTNITTGVILDDFAQTKLEFEKIDEHIHIVNMKNTACTPIPKPDLKDKGRHRYQPYCLIASSNADDLNSGKSNEPAAIMRRFDVVVEAYVAPDFVKPPRTQPTPEMAAYIARHGEAGCRTHFRPEEIAAVHGMVDARKLSQGVSTPFQRYNVKEAVPIKEEGPAARGWVWNYLAKDLTYDQLMRFLRPKLVEHLARQKAYAEEMQEEADEPLCRHGHTTAKRCAECRDVAQLEAAHAQRMAQLSVQAGDDEADGYAVFSTCMLDSLSYPSYGGMLYRVLRFGHEQYFWMHILEGLANVSDVLTRAQFVARVAHVSGHFAYLASVHQSRMPSHGVLVRTYYRRLAVRFAAYVAATTGFAPITMEEAHVSVAVLRAQWAERATLGAQAGEDDTADESAPTEGEPSLRERMRASWRDLGARVEQSNARIRESFHGLSNNATAQHLDDVMEFLVPETPPTPPPPPEPPRRTWRDKWRSLWSLDIKEDADRPFVVRAVDAASGGRAPIENYYIKHPVRTTYALFTGVPVLVCVCVGALSACFVGSFGTLAITTMAAGVSNFTLSRAGMAWLKGRVEGYTLMQLRRKVIEVSTSGTVLLVGGVLAALSIAAACRWLRSKPPEEKSNIHISVNTAAPPSANQPVVTPAQSPPAHTDFPASVPAYNHAQSPPRPLERTATGESVPSVSSAEPEFVENGGCIARPTPAPPDRVFRENPWAVRELSPVHAVEGPARGMTYDQAMARIERQLFLVRMRYESGREVTTQAFMVVTNIAQMPAHNFYNPAGDFTPVREMVFQRTSALHGPAFRARVTEHCVERMPGDMCLVNVAVGGTMADVMPFVSHEIVSQTLPIVELSRVRDGDQDFMVKRLMYRAEPDIGYSPRFGVSYPALRYVRPEATFKGLCGALLIVPGKYPTIVGMHTMGGEGALCHVGQACLMTRHDIEAAASRLRARCTVKTPPIVANTLKPHVPEGSEDRAELRPLAANSVLREAQPGTPIEALGTLPEPNVRQKTRLMISPYANLVEQSTRETRGHEPPRNIGKAVVEVKHLGEMSEAPQLDPDIYRLAFQDSLDELVAVYRATPGADAYVKPLSYQEALSGVHMCSSIKRINLSTAPGWPRTGDKRGLVVPAPSDDRPDDIDLSPELLAEVLGMEAKMKRLERVNTVFKCSHKDEPVPVGKQKVRIFKGSQLAFNIIVRRLYLPIMRLYHDNRLETGCAVGTNATGLDWDRMARHLKEYAPDDLVIGDWRHYDTSLAYQEMMSQFAKWVHIAELSGNYDSDDVSVMWVVAEEICRHYAAMRGDLFVSDGGNSSGQGLTSYCNGASNRDRMCYGFYKLALGQDKDQRLCAPLVVGSSPLEEMVPGYREHLRSNPLVPGLGGRFADYVREQYYGDDMLNAPQKAACPWFTQVALATLFAEDGKAFTDAHKELHSVDYTPWAEATFLKRRFRLDPSGVYTAPLEMPSIYKGLYVVKKDLPFGLEAHYAEVIDGAVRELVEHGLEEYLERVPGLVELATNVGCASLCRNLDASEEGFRRLLSERL